MQTITEHFIEVRSGALIHCLSNGALNNDGVLVIIPGNINDADETLNCLPSDWGKDTLIISLRGRGKSSSSALDYSLINQANDIADVIIKLNLKRCFLFGLSVGASIGIVAASQIKERMMGYIIGDFAPYYPKYTENWIREIKNIENKRITDMTIERIATDSQYTDVVEFYQNINCPKLLLRGMNNTSLLKDNQVLKMSGSINGLQVMGIENAGHEILAEQPHATMLAVKEFINRVSSG